MLLTRILFACTSIFTNLLISTFYVTGTVTTVPSHNKTHDQIKDKVSSDSMMLDLSVKNDLIETYLTDGKVRSADSLLNFILKKNPVENPYLIAAYTKKIKILYSYESYEQAMGYIKNGLVAIDQTPFDLQEIKSFCEISKRVLFKLKDVNHLYLVDSLQASVQDSLSSYVGLSTRNLDKTFDQLNDLELTIQVKDRVIYNNQVVIIFLVTSLLTLILIFGLFRHRYHLKQQLEEALIQSDQAAIEKRSLEKQLILQKIEQQERQLSSYTAHLVQKNEALDYTLSKIKKYRMQKNGEGEEQGLNEIVNFLERNLSNEDQWNNFLSHFENIHPNFFQQLKSDYPDLSRQDRRMLAYMRMELSSKEIAQLVGINYESVNTSRYRIRKKLNLPKDVDLDDFVSAL